MNDDIPTTTEAPGSYFGRRLSIGEPNDYGFMCGALLHRAGLDATRYPDTVDDEPTWLAVREAVLRAPRLASLDQFDSGRIRLGAYVAVRWLAFVASEDDELWPAAEPLDKLAARLREPGNHIVGAAGNLRRAAELLPDDRAETRVIKMCRSFGNAGVAPGAVHGRVAKATTKLMWNHPKRDLLTRAFDDALATFASPA